MDTVFLIVRWAGALFLFLMAVIMAVETCKRRELGRQRGLLFAVGVAVSSCSAALGYGLITWQWSPLWLVLRGVGTLPFLAAASEIVEDGKKRPGLGALYRIAVLFTAAIFVPPAVSIALLEWRWLLLSPAFIVIAGILKIAARARNRMRALEQLSHAAPPPPPAGGTPPVATVSIPDVSATRARLITVFEENGPRPDPNQPDIRFHPGGIFKGQR